MKWWQIVLMWQGVISNLAALLVIGWMWWTRHDDHCDKCEYVSLERVDKRWLY